MRFVAGYLSKYKKESIAAPLFKMLEAIFELLVPLVMAKVIDVGIANRDVTYIYRMCAILIALAVIGLVVALTAQYFAAMAAVNTAGAIRRDLFYHVTSFSEGVRSAQGEGALVTRLTNDVNQVQNGINMFLRLFLRSPFIVFGAFVMSCIVDLKASVIYLIVLPVLTFIVVGVMRATLPMYASVQEKLSHIFTIVDENLEGVRVIRAFRNEGVQRQHFDEETDDLRRSQLAAGRLAVLPGPLTFGVVNLAIVWLLWYSGAQVNIGSLTTGETVALVNYMSQILIELVKLANLILLLTRAFSSVHRIEEVIETENDERRHDDDLSTLEDENAKGKKLLEMSHVSFSYGDGRKVLNDISLDLDRGETIGIIGGTGSGKSTLIRLIMHTYDAGEGEIYLDGRPISAYNDKKISDMIANVPQQAKLFSGTVRSNLLMADENAKDDEMWSALSVAQADVIVKNKEGGLDAAVRSGGTNFSGGQRQRLTIARAVLKRSDITILDDSASALDLATERSLREALKKDQGNRGYIIVSQRASFVRGADRILVLEHGEVEGYGSHEELMAQCETYRQIYYTQYEKEGENG